MTPRFEGFAGRLSVGFSMPAINTFTIHQQLRFWHRERGGILLATSVGESDGIVDIVKATPPHHDDRAGRHWLKLDHGRVQAEIDEAFENGLHFVGYWHTHPQLQPRISSQDVAAIMPAIRNADLDLQRVLMVVVGGCCDTIAIDACTVDRVTQELERLVCSQDRHFRID